MTSTRLVEPVADALAARVTARAFLLGEGEETTKALAKAISDHGILGSLPGALRGMSKAGQHAIGEQISAAVGHLLELDVSDYLVSGWRKHRALIAAAQRTSAAPGSEELVDLCTHRITSKHSPYVDILVEDHKVTSINFEVSLEFTVKGAVALVRFGRLAAVRCGECDIEGGLSVEGAPVCSRSRHFSLPLLVHLGDDGLALLRGPQVPRPRMPGDEAATSPRQTGAPTPSHGD